MKKLLAIFLAMICAFSACAVSASAATLEDVLGDIVEDQLGVTQEESDLDAITYGVFFENDSTSSATVLYMPIQTLTFGAPVITTITTDTPVAVDHDWVCWKDKSTGALYYPGDEIEVTGQVRLVAVWQEKTDNYPSFIRMAIAGLQAFIKLIDKFLNAFESINNTRPLDTTETTTAVVA